MTRTATTPTNTPANTPAAALLDKVVDKVLRAYGLEYSRILAPQKGYRNQSFPVVLASGEMRNLILYKREPGITARIKAANTVSDFLAGQGFPARQTADERIIKLDPGHGRPAKYGALYTYLDGHTIPWEAYTQDHLKALGEMMGNMHAALAAFPADEASQLPAATDEYLAIVSRMKHYFNEAPVQRALSQKLQLAMVLPRLEYFEQLLRGITILPGQQALHMDFVRGNILFAEAGLSESGPSATESEPRISGILDFEKTAYGHPLLDIARTLAFLCVDCKYKPEEKVRKYFLGSGYAKRGGAPLPARLSTTLLDPLVEFFLSYDFYKFLRHNPYEFLHQNEHFTRTRDMLMTRGVVTSSTSVA